MVVLDLTVMNLALPSAQRALGFTTADRQWVVTAYALSFGGLLLLIGQGEPALLLRHGIGLGDGLMLLATLAYAAYGVLLRKWPMPVPTWQMLYVQVLAAAVLLLPGWWLAPPSPITAANLPLVLYAGIAASIVSAFLWMEGVAGLGAARAAMYMNLLPLLTALIAIVLLSERLHGYHLAGGAITLAGVLLAQGIVPLRSRGVCK
jgi:drug/metabolite transporter (DMT)-like permease